MSMKQPCVYMMASGRNGTLYVGVTADIIARVSQHRAGCVEGFTKQYGVNMLVWFESMKPWQRRLPARKPSRIGNGCGKQI
ncbi:MAG TPA: GIY-YIG nuclease family protein [Pseudoxanthomonas sp.]|nr:GIY-YIG nuclease family protein [Pseudoxanthomonas sp.]